MVLVALSVALAGCTAHSRPQTVPRVYVLDIEAPEAIQGCAEAHGLAGWLQRIDECGEYIDPPAIPYCVILDDQDRSGAGFPDQFEWKP